MRADSVSSSKSDTTPGERPGRRELWFLAILCVAGAARILIGAAVLPFFADTDEAFHFDLVHKFSRGFWPNRPVSLLDSETVELQIFDASPEFALEPKTVPAVGDYPPPLRSLRNATGIENFVALQRTKLSQLPNHEAYEPPLYYALAAIWFDCGKSFGMSDRAGVYWLRCLNGLLYGLLIATSYAVARPYFGGATALGVAALVAFFPNPVYFTVSNDVLAPVTGAIALLLLLRWCHVDAPGRGLAAAAGAAAAAAVLVKLSSAAALTALVVALFMRLFRDGRWQKTAAYAWPMLLATAAPLALWVARNRIVLGNWSGTGGRLAVRGLKAKPLSEWLDHPLFTFGGLGEFLRKLCISLISGDSMSHGRPVHSAPVELYFLVTIPVLVVAALVAAWSTGRREKKIWDAAALSLVIVVVAVAALAIMSLSIDFGAASFPSRESPYYAFGRLTGVALVPLLVLYAVGARALSGRRTALFAGFISVSVLMMILGQVGYLKGFASSQFNWFRLS
jgi:uncharacterized membrane protein